MLVKCPKCELNYMESTDRMCKVCFREIHGTDMPEEQDLCSVCNVTPVMTGKEVCSSCFRELKAQRAAVSDDDDADEVLDDEDKETIDDDMDEDLVGNEDMPEPEFREIDRNLSLDELGEQEEADSEEEEDEEL